MKSIRTILSIAAAALVAISVSSCAQNQQSASAAEGDNTSEAQKGAVVFFNLDKILNDYDMANDLRSVVQTKVESINQEVNRKGAKLEKEMKAFQEKIDKGLLTRSVAEAQAQKLEQQRVNFQNYAAQKQQEIAEEQNVMMNNIAESIRAFVEEYNAEKQYAMILTTQGDILTAPVVTADPALDITEDLLAGLNAAYVQSKAKEK